MVYARTILTDLSPASEARFSTCLFSSLRQRFESQMIAMRNKALASAEEDLLIGLTFHNVPASLVAEFIEKIVRPYYKGNLNVAFQDLIHKALLEQDFVLSHITHVRNVVEA